MKPTKMIAGLAIAGSLGAGLVTLGTGVATADPGWGPPPPPPGPGWGPPPPDHHWGPPPRDRNWGPPPPPDGNPPGTWNGGWEPDGGVCLFGACI
ncbi:MULTISPECIES: hypothetical protein [Mycobacteriaceae]|jgi:hypothetical protein|uniref:Chitin-binding protein n=1 Tax=Mycolicibacterium mucogenicum TaxID=56689 RepID=A0A1A0N0Y5_MYCMU|nr:hypothetical protein [Mycolicibacterium mucogenicum]MCX8558447.1 hypothetical protein [Mycolicibacterium mucogenicum]OBA91292.1 hypothetical protein A5642_10805 [Mycolicibacterium mucogenicum]